MIKDLVLQYERLKDIGKVPSFGWVKEKIGSALLISSDGSLERIIPLFEEEVKGKKLVKVPQIKLVPIHKTASSGLMPYFLCDSSKYFLGIYDDSKELLEIKSLINSDENQEEIDKLKEKLERNRNRAKSCFEKSREYHHELLDNVDDPKCKAVLSFFDKWDSEKISDEILKTISKDQFRYNFVFIFKQDYILNSLAVKQIWNNFLVKNSSDKTTMRCLVTGKISSIALIHGKIKGIKNAQQAGASLVSFNSPSFESYGKNKSQGINAPISEYAAFAYVSTLNYLLKEKKNHIIIGEDTYVFWSENCKVFDCEDIFLAALNTQNGSSELLVNVMEKMANGDKISEDFKMDTKFHIICFSPNNARISARFYYVNNFGNLIQSLEYHYSQLEIVRPIYSKFKYLSLYFLLNETVRPESGETASSPMLAARLLESIISGKKYPESIYIQIIMRIRLNRGKYKVTPTQVAIIKAFLLRNKGNIINKEEITVSLNVESENVAYNLGCAFSILEQIQESANPGLNSTIKDRYFNSSCTTPGTTFPILFRLGNSHLKKIEKSREVYFNKMLQNILGKIEEFPKRLSLTEQGMFILGYYHQTQKRFEKKNIEEEK